LDNKVIETGIHAKNRPVAFFSFGGGEGCKTGHPPSSTCNFDIKKVPRRPIRIENMALRNRRRLFLLL